MSSTPHRRRILLVAVLAALAAGTAACAPSDADASDDGLQVYVSFAPLAYLAERIGGDLVEVVNLTPPGADPHAAELSPAAVADLAEADLLVYVSGLQASVDAAVAAAPPHHLVDTLEAATTEVAGEADPPNPHRDPHFWLDPVRFGIAGEQVAEALAEIDPAHADRYRSTAAEVVADLADLDADYAARLAPCAGAGLVTSHEAFGYLAARYGLQQTGITGIDPEVEPSPARLREVRSIIEETGVRTLFLETAADPAVAQTLAEDLGVTLDVLDPMERPSDPDYLTVMRDNLAALERGLVCTG